MPINKFAIAALITICSMYARAQVVAAPSLSTSATQNEAVKSSVVTVDDLIRKENAALLAAAGPKAGSLEAASRPAKRTPTAPRVEVLSIYGTAGSIRADLVVDGAELEGAKVGTKVGPCVITAIANRCVALEPVAGSVVRQCNRSCWTGVPALNPQVGTTGALLPPGVPSGMSMPAPLAPSPRP